MTPSDARQLHQMLAVISAARTGSVALNEAANSLLFLRDALDQVEESWADRFTSHVATLESAGVATTAQVESMGKRYDAVVGEALNALEQSVRTILPSMNEEDDR